MISVGSAATGWLAKMTADAAAANETPRIQTVDLILFIPSAKTG